MVVLRIMLWLGMAGLLVSCTSSTRMLLTSDIPRAQTNYKKVQVYFQEPPRKARPLALIAVARDGENAAWTMEILKMEAAVLGADALANVEVTYTTGFLPNLRVQGLAVKYVE